MVHESPWNETGSISSIHTNNLSSVRQCNTSDMRANIVPSCAHTETPLTRECRLACYERRAEASYLPYRKAAIQNVAQPLALRFIALPRQDSMIHGPEVPLTPVGPLRRSRSATPRSATPRSATPRSATPRSATPRSARSTCVQSISLFFPCQLGHLLQRTIWKT